MSLESLLALVERLGENSLVTHILSSLAGGIFAWFIYRARSSERRSSESNVHYGETDDFYFRLLQMRVDHPYLGLPEQCLRDAERRESYNNYAFMVWNFLETVYDRFHGKPQCEDHRITWQPIIESEGSSHLHWFGKPENSGPRGKFKPKFVDFICSGGFIECSESGHFAQEAYAALAPMLPKERREQAALRIKERGFVSTAEPGRQDRVAMPA